MKLKAKIIYDWQQPRPVKRYYSHAIYSQYGQDCLAYIVRFGKGCRIYNLNEEPIGLAPTLEAAAQFFLDKLTKVAA